MSLATLSLGHGGPRIAFLHGLFGQGRNWAQIAKGVCGEDGTGARDRLRADVVTDSAPSRRT